LCTDRYMKCGCNSAKCDFNFDAKSLSKVERKTTLNPS
jgi:predicted small metal-binding protein